MENVEKAALPPGWAWARLEDICGIVGGITVDAKRRGPDLVELPYLRVANVQRGRLDLSVVKQIAVPQAQAERLRLCPGDVLLNEGGDRDKVGRGWVWEGQIENCIFQNHVFRARPRHESIQPRWLSYYLNEAARAYFLSGSKQTTNLASLSLAKVAATPVAVPPANEQRRLVEMINALLGEVDDIEAAMKRARGQTADYRASLLHAACTGALTADWRAANPHPPEDGHALLRRILAERRAAWERTELARLTATGKVPRGEAWKRRYPEPIAANSDSLDPLSSTWTWASLDQLTSVITSGSRAWSPYYGRGAGTFIMAQNVRSGRFNPLPRQPVDPPFDDPERKRTAVERDDVLVTIVGANTGDACRIDSNLIEHYVCQSVGLLRPVNAGISAFLETYLIAPTGGQAAFKQMMYGAGRPHLSFDQLRSIPIPLPPLSEQSQIVVEARDHAIDALSGEMGSIGVGDELVDLRQSILHAAFTGRLVPQDPADEPAATLLARLRTQAAPSAPRRRTA